MLKRFGIIVLMLLVLVGCGAKNNDKVLPKSNAGINVEFSEYLDNLFISFIDPSDFTLNLLIKDAEKMGVELEPYQLSFSSASDYEAWIKEAKNMLKELSKFKDKSLSNQQIIDKYVLIEYLQNTIDMAPYYDYEYGSTVIGMSRSILGSLPAYLESYTFRNQQDLDYYFNFLESLPANIEKYIQLELERQERGTGFSSEELNEIASQYREIGNHAKRNDYFLLIHFEKTVAPLDFVADKYSTFDKNKELIQNQLSNSYIRIAEAFEKIEGKEAQGLVHRPNGKEYYEILLRQSTGKNATVTEIEELIDTKYDEIITHLQFLDEEKHNTMFERLISNEYGEFKDGEELLQFLESKYSHDYPEITIPNYELRQVDPSMEDSSSPAFYFTPPVDYVSGDKQLIYINGEFDNSLFTTYAHEGIPGHMYQFTYFSDLKEMHPIRNLVSSNANAEGWANYTENRAVEYISDNEYQAFYSDYQTLTNIAYIKADIGVNYHGWDRSELGDYLETFFGPLEEDEVDDMFVNLVTNPAVYPTYYLSSLYFEDLREHAQKELDDKFDLVTFHKYVLDSGSASFNIIEKMVNQYILDNQ